MGERMLSPRAYENKSADPEFHNKFLEISSVMSREDAKFNQLQTLVMHAERLHEVEALITQYEKLGIDDEEYDLLKEEKNALSVGLLEVTISYEGRSLPPLTELSSDQLNTLLEANRHGKKRLLDAAINVFNDVDGNNSKRKDMLH